MRVSGFTFVRDAIRLGYPVAESIASVLPLVDELVVNVGTSSDGTIDLVRGIRDPRLVVFETRWDERELERGRVLAQQTDLALARCTGEVCLYIQADEALHEEDHPRIAASLRRLTRPPGGSVSGAVRGPRGPHAEATGGRARGGTGCRRQ